MRDSAGRDWPAEVPLALDDLTLGQMAKVERESGLSFEVVLQRAATRRIAALYLYGSSNFEPAPSWSEVAALRWSDAPSSERRSRSAGRRGKRKS